MIFTAILYRRFFLVQNILLIIFLSTTISNAQRIVTISGGAGDGRDALKAQLFFPSAVTIDGAGNIYIGDEGTHSIRKVDATTRIISLYAGNGIEGLKDNIQALEASLSDPSGIITDGSGNIYFADQVSSVIRKIDGNTGIITTIAGTGAFGFAGDGDSPRNAKFSSPSTIAIDAVGNIYVADTGNKRVRKINFANRIIATVVGNGIGGFSGDGGPATEASISSVDGIAIDQPGNIYLSDPENYRIRKVNVLTGLIETIAGNGEQGYSGDDGFAINAKLSGPHDLFLDKQGNLIFLDGQRVRSINLTTTIISTIGGGGTTYEEGGLAESTLIDTPSGLTSSDNGDIYFSEYRNAVVRKISEGIITTVVGLGNFGGDGGLAINANLKHPQSLAIDNDNNLYFSDYWNNRIRKINQSTGVIETVAGNGDGRLSADNVTAIETSIAAPYGMKTDEFNNVFFTDNYNGIYKIDQSTGKLKRVADPGNSVVYPTLSGPSAITYDTDHNLYIVETGAHRIQKIDLSSGTITTIAGNGTSGFSGDGGLAISAQLFFPSDIIVNAQNDLFVADRFNSRIRKIDATTGIISTVAGGGSGGDGVLATSASIFAPNAIAFDSRGNLFIAQASAIRRIDATTGIVTKYAESQRGYSLDDGNLANAAFGNISDIIFDKDDNLYLTDSENNWIRKIIPRKSQTLVFDSIPEKTQGQASFALNALASSNLAIIFTSSNINVASIDDNKVTLPGAGKITITAVQPGDPDYEPVQMAQTFCVDPAKPVITTSGVFLTSSASAGNQWYFNNQVLTGATAATLAATESGSYTVKSIIDDCISEISEAISLVITGLEDSFNKFEVYPNPTNSTLNVNLNGLSGDITVSIYDMLGRRKDLLTATGKDTLVINTTAYSSGNYILVINYSIGSVHKRFVKN
jgi:sugar lactone lactonase YvrE